MMSSPYMGAEDGTCRRYSFVCFGGVSSNNRSDPVDRGYQQHRPLLSAINRRAGIDRVAGLTGSGGFGNTIQEPVLGNAALVCMFGTNHRLRYCTLYSREPLNNRAIPGITGGHGRLSAPLVVALVAEKACSPQVRREAANLPSC